MIYTVISHGFVGVSLFFVLSGFILVYTYVEKYPHGKIARRDFWIARVARIYPTYLFALAVAAVPMLYWYQTPPACATYPRIIGMITAPLLVQSWIPCAQSVWNTPGWSLSVEAFFYLLFPFLLAPIARMGNRGIIIVGGLAWVTSLSVVLVYIGLAPNGTVNRDYAFWLQTVTDHPLVHLPEFVIGMALGRLFLLRATTQRRERTAGVSSVLTILATFVIVALLCVNAFGVGANGFQLPVNLLLMPCFALLIYGLAWGEGLIARMLSQPTTVLLGEASYALYLLHGPVRTWMDSVAFHFHQGALIDTTLFFCVYLACAIGASIVTVIFIERPARIAHKRALVRRPIPEPAPIGTTTR